MRREGIADQELAQREKAREHNSRSGSQSPSKRHPTGAHKRSRSRSTASSDSVETISTNKSRSSSPTRGRKHAAADAYVTSQQIDATISSSRSRSKGKKRRYSSSSAYSSSRSSSRRRSTSRHRKTRRRRTISPDHRGRTNLEREAGVRSRDNSMDQSRVARERKSLTVDENLQHSEKLNGVRRGTSPKPDRRDTRAAPARGRGTTHSARSKPLSRKERSLSPYSKRLALTQAMNGG